MMDKEYKKRVVRLVKIHAFKELGKESAIPTLCNGCGYVDLLDLLACPYCGGEDWGKIE